MTSKKKSIVVLRTADGMFSMEEWSGPTPDRIVRSLPIKMSGPYDGPLPDTIPKIPTRTYLKQDQGVHGLVSFYNEEL